MCILQPIEWHFVGLQTYIWLLECKQANKSEKGKVAFIYLLEKESRTERRFSCWTGKAFFIAWKLMNGT